MYMGTAILRRGPLYYKLLEREKQAHLEAIEQQRKDRLMIMHQRVMDEAMEKQRARQALLMQHGGEKPVLGKSITIEHQAIPIKAVFEAVALHDKIPLADIMGESRSAKVVMSRHIAFYLCVKLSKRGWSEMKHYTGRDHTTILHGFRRVSKLVCNDPEMNARVHQISVDILTDFGHDPHFWGS